MAQTVGAATIAAYDAEAAAFAQDRETQPPRFDLHPAPNYV
jgi:hypothetical protein